MSYAPSLNATRTAQAAARDVGIAFYALSHWDPLWPEQWEKVARERVLHQDESWAELGGYCEMTKDRAVACFRRLRRAVCAAPHLPRWCASCPALTFTDSRPACCGQPNRR